MVNCLFRLRANLFSFLLFIVSNIIRVLPTSQGVASCVSKSFPDREGFRIGFLSTLRPTLPIGCLALEIPISRLPLASTLYALHPTLPLGCLVLEIPISRSPSSCSPPLKGGAGGRLVFQLCVEWGLITIFK